MTGTTIRFKSTASLAISLYLAAFSAYGETTRDVIYGHKDGMALVMDVYQPDGNANGAAVAYMVSGGFMSNLRLQRGLENIFMALVNNGFTVFAVRHGSSPHYLVPDAVSDVSQGFQFIGDNAENWNIDPSRIGVSGISAGGHLTLMLGLHNDNTSRHRPAAVVAYQAPAELTGRTGPNTRFPAMNFDESLAPSLSPINLVTPDDPPTLLVHGDNDELVPVENSHRMYAALQEAGVESEFLLIPGAGHGMFQGEDAIKVENTLLRWFQDHL